MHSPRTAAPETDGNECFFGVAEHDLRLQQNIFPQSVPKLTASPRSAAPPRPTGGRQNAPGGEQNAPEGEQEEGRTRGASGVKLSAEPHQTEVLEFAGEQREDSAWEVTAEEAQEYAVVAQALDADAEMVDRALEIVKDFIAERGLVLYGGLAIDYALRLKGERLYPPGERPDYDAYSPRSVDDAYDLAERLQDAGFPKVSAIRALHVQTMRVRVNFVGVADLSYVPPAVFERLPALRYQSLRVVHPDFQRADMHLAFCFPFSNPPLEDLFHRFPKDQKRIALLDRLYRIDTGARLGRAEISGYSAPPNDRPGPAKEERAVFIAKQEKDGNAGQNGTAKKGGAHRGQTPVLAEQEENGGEEKTGGRDAPSNSIGRFRPGRAALHGIAAHGALGRALTQLKQLLDEAPEGLLKTEAEARIDEVLAACPSFRVESAARGAPIQIAYAAASSAESGAFEEEDEPFLLASPWPEKALEDAGGAGKVLAHAAYLDARPETFEQATGALPGKDKIRPDAELRRRVRVYSTRLRLLAVSRLTVDGATFDVVSAQYLLLHYLHEALASGAGTARRERYAGRYANVFAMVRAADALFGALEVVGDSADPEAPEGLRRRLAGLVQASPFGLTTRVMGDRNFGAGYLIQVASEAARTGQLPADPVLREALPDLGRLPENYYPDKPKYKRNGGKEDRPRFVYESSPLFTRDGRRLDEAHSVPGGQPGGSAAPAAPAAPAGKTPSPAANAPAAILGAEEQGRFTEAESGLLASWAEEKNTEPESPARAQPDDTLGSFDGREEDYGFEEFREYCPHLSRML